MSANDPTRTFAPQDLGNCSATNTPGPRRLGNRITTNPCLLLAQIGHSILSHLMSLSGAKRTYLFALQMSAYDPKQTLGASVAVFAGTIASPEPRGRQ